MQPLLYWVIGYLLPMLFTYFFYLYVFQKTKHGKKDWAQFILIHTSILISIFLSQHFLHQNKIMYSFHTSGFSLGLLLIVSLGSIRLLGKFGLFYLLSSFLQQLCITSITHLLLNFYSLTAVLVLLVPLYVLGHIHNRKQWKTKTTPTLLWGITGVLLYSVTFDLFLNTALHLLIGTYGIKRRVLYTEIEI